MNSNVTKKSQPVSFLERFILLFALAAFVLSYLGQLNFDSWMRYSNRRINTTYNLYIEPQPLSPTAAKIISFGARELMADWYWLSAIQYYGGGDPQGQYRKLAELFDTITELSPKFTAAYQMGLLILPGEGFVNEGLLLGAKGEKNIPTSWEVPYYRGLIYHIYKKDYVAAAKEFELAASKPNAPANARYFAAIYYNQADQRQTAYLLFKNLYENSTDTFVKERAKKYLDHLAIVFYLEEGVKSFHEKYGRFPTDLNELVRRGVVAGIPASPLGREYSVNPTTGAIFDSKAAR